MSFSRQRGKPTRQKRLITLSNLLTNSTQLVDRHYSHFSVRAATTLSVQPARPSVPTYVRIIRIHTRTQTYTRTLASTGLGYTGTTGTRKRHSDIGLYTYGSRTVVAVRKACVLVIQRRYRVTSCKAIYIQPTGILVRVVEGVGAVVVNIHRTLFSARVPGGTLLLDRSIGGADQPPLLRSLASKVKKKEGERPTDSFSLPSKQTFRRLGNRLMSRVIFAPTQIECRRDTGAARVLIVIIVEESWLWLFIPYFLFL